MRKKKTKDEKIGICLHQQEGELVEVSMWLLHAETLEHIMEIPMGPTRKWVRMSGHAGREGGDTLVLPDDVTVYLDSIGR